MSSREQREKWRQLGLFVSQLGLAEGEPAPVQAIEDLANAVLALDDELAEARRWARSCYDAMSTGTGLEVSRVPTWMLEDDA